MKGEFKILQQEPEIQVTLKFNERELTTLLALLNAPDHKLIDSTMDGWYHLDAGMYSQGKVTVSKEWMTIFFNEIWGILDEAKRKLV